MWKKALRIFTNLSSETMFSEAYDSDNENSSLKSGHAVAECSEAWLDLQPKNVLGNTWHFPSDSCQKNDWRPPGETTAVCSSIQLYSSNDILYVSK